MLKYAKKTGEHTYDVGLGTSKASEDFYKSLGMVQADVEQGVDGNWYDVGFAPKEKPIADKIAELDAQYNHDKAELLTAYQTAQLYGDTDTMESLKADLTALDEQYDEDYEKIVGGE
jgi:hypothetical protein